ncbi:MAG: Calx-beta domain-containing protein [Blastocatellia bacterium]
MHTLSTRALLAVVFSMTLAIAAYPHRNLLSASAPPAMPMPISLNMLGAAYNETFDTLADTGTANTVTPAGWEFSETGSAANTTYAAGPGSSTTANTYSFGTTAERAFGTLRSSSLNATIGASFINNTGQPVTKLLVQYTGEQWRLGAAARTDRLDFQYSVNATSLTAGTWTDVDALDFTTPNTTTTGAKDGNAAANRTVITATVTGLFVAPGATFYIRWTDFDATGSDDGLAVDNFSLTPLMTPTLTISDAMQTEAPGGASVVFEVTLSAFDGNTVTVSYATLNGMALAGADYQATSGSLTFSPAENILTKQIMVPLVDDCQREASENFIVRLSNAVNAAPVKTDGLGTIADDDLAGTVQFGAGMYSVSEGAGTALVTVTRTGGMASGATIKYAISNGTAQSGMDYTVVSGTLTFACEQTTQSFTIPILNDNLVETDNETIPLTLSAPGGGAAHGAPATAELMIIDDDGAGVGAPGDPTPASAEISAQKTGTVLIFPAYVSSATRPERENTRLSITNTDTSRMVYVHVFFVENGGVPADSYVCLTPNQTVTFLASEMDPGESGYVVAVAVDKNTGCPINFNYLMGSESVKYQSGHAAALNAEAIAALPGATLKCDLVDNEARLDFNGEEFNLVPRMVGVDHLMSPAEGNATMLIFNRIGGNLIRRAATTGGFFGILYDDMENPHSFETSGSVHLRRIISNDFPRTTPRYSTLIPPGRTGWLKMWTASDNGIIGAVINHNPNTATGGNAFAGGRNLPWLRMADRESLTIPVYPPHCG